jgi:hypothetical protein
MRLRRSYLGIVVIMTVFYTSTEALLFSAYYLIVTRAGYRFYQNRQLFGPLFNWGLYGVLCVQFCETFIHQVRLSN